MKSLLAISILLFAAPFLLYFCCSPNTPGPFDLELEDFEIFCSVHDKDGRVGWGLDGYRVDKTDAFNVRIRLEDERPWPLALLRKSGEVYGFPAAMACSPNQPFWIETDPLVSVDIFMVDPLTMDTISVSKHLGFLNSGSAIAPYDIFYPARHDWSYDPRIDFTLVLSGRRISRNRLTFLEKRSSVQAESWNHPTPLSFCSNKAFGLICLPLA